MQTLLLVCHLLFAAPTPLEGASYEVGFSPSPSALKLVLKGIESAQKEVLVAAYSFTSKPIALALLKAHKRGVSVRIVVNPSKAKTYSGSTFLANHGVSVRVNDRYAIHLHKFMVIDSVHLETGSFNYSAAAANRNAENVLMIWNAGPLAQVYAKEWVRLWNEGQDVKANY